MSVDCLWLGYWEGWVAEALVGAKNNSSCVLERLLHLPVSLVPAYVMPDCRPCGCCRTFIRGC